LPYPSHPRGCPNYNHKYGCPPKARLIEEAIDLGRTTYLVIVKFDLAKHINEMLMRHPHWSNRQARCVLYWQGGVNKELKFRTCEAKWELEGFNDIFMCPEAMGINIIKTVRDLGIPIKARPVDTVFKVALLAASR